MGEQKKKLFSEFPPVSTSDWEAMIKKDLKGADYEKKLVWNTREGFNVKPYYRDEDLQGIDAAATLPGAFPFVRGNKVKGNDWYIRQNIRVNKVEAANKKALDILMKGVNSLGFVLDDNKEYSKEDLDGLCRNIFAEIVELNFVCGRQAENIAGLYLDLVQQYNRDFRKVHGSVNFDPLGRLVIKGNYYDSFDEDFERCRRLINLTTNLPNFSVITVNGRNFHHAGSSIVQELAFSLAAGAEYLTQLSERGLSVDKVATGMRFNFSIGPDYFMEMARIRAARQLWANIVKAYGPSSDDIARMSIHSETASWNITVYDPYVNMLRTTTESMSAAIAGVDSHIVRPFDGAFSKPDEFSERIARNQQLLLKEEVYLDKVADPAAGSYYIESLTDQMVQEAWKIFLEIEEKGGYIEAVKSGYIQQKVRGNAEAMDKAIATRKMSLLGTNQYPDFTERIEKYIPAEVFKPSVFTEKDAIVETLTPYRGSQAFEVLRKKTDDYSRENKRPAVFMFTYGNLTMRIARAQFAGNFFAVPGFDLIDNPGFKTIDDGVQAAIESKAGIVVICSSDDEYASIAPEIYKKLKDHAIVMLAGYPKDIIEDLKQAGMKHFIHMHSNVLESLQEIQQELGI
ncbi:MAG: acyl-CoA mutase large subunit family protein [Bacteroidales bacterium]|nr:acyl-CoA mutase large subunit family protein [Bacteroidales bacterium]